MLTICMEFSGGIFRTNRKEQYIFSSKNRTTYNAVPFVKNDPVEFSRLG